MTRLRHVIGSAALYPISALYAGAVLLFWCAMREYLSVPAALIILGLVAALAVGWSAYREARTVHRRIDELTEMLVAAGVAAPRGSVRAADRQAATGRTTHG